MILYHTTNIHMLLIFAIHKMRNKDKKGALLFPKWPNIGWPKISDIRNIFDEVYAYPNTSMPYPKTEADVMRFGEKMYRDVFSIRIEDFDEIFNAGLYVPFLVYLTLKGVPPVRMAMSSNISFLREQTLSEIIEADSGIGLLAKKYGVITMENDCVDKIYTTSSNNDGVLDDRIVPFYESKLLQSITQEEKKSLFKLYKMNLDLHDLESATILITTPISMTERLHTMKMQGEFYGLLVDYYMKENSQLYIKAHPADNFNYETVFGDVTILQRFSPLELIFLDVDTSKVSAICSCTSSALKQFSDIIDFRIEPAKPYKYLDWIQKAHRYYACKMIYETLSNDTAWEFQAICPHNSFFRHWSIDVSEDGHECNSSEKPTFLVISDDSVRMEELKVLIQKSIYVLIFEHAQSVMYDVAAETSIFPLTKVLHIRGRKIDRNECIYIFTNDYEEYKKIRNLKFERHLKFTEQVIRMDCMTEYELEIESLKGMLEATEKRLKEVLEENEVLRERLECDERQP